MESLYAHNKPWPILYSFQFFKFFQKNDMFNISK